MRFKSRNLTFRSALIAIVIVIIATGAILESQLVSARVASGSAPVTTAAPSLPLCREMMDVP